MASAPATTCTVTPLARSSLTSPRTRVKGITMPSTPLIAKMRMAGSHPRPTARITKPATTPTARVRARRTSARSREVAATIASAPNSNARNVARLQSAAGAAIANTTATSVTKKTAP